MKNLNALIFAAFLGCNPVEVVSPPPTIAPPADMASPPQLLAATPRMIPIGLETVVKVVGIGSGLDELQRSSFSFGLDCDYDIAAFTYTPTAPNAFSLSLNVRPGVVPAVCDLVIRPQGLKLSPAFSLVP